MFLLLLLAPGAWLLLRHLSVTQKVSVVVTRRRLLLVNFVHRLSTISMAANIELLNRRYRCSHHGLRLRLRGWSGAGGCGETNGMSETLDEKARRREDENTLSERRASGN